MQRYVCSHCDDLECESSVCPVCGSKANLINSKIYWCDECNAPSFGKECGLCHSSCREIGHDLRPVFPEERLLLEILIGEPFKYSNSSIWCLGGAVYVIDGQRVQFKYKDLMANDSNEVIRQLETYRERNQSYCDGYFDSPAIRNFVEANRDHLSRIEYEAINYIQKKTEGIGREKMFVSFSGGKDSTVTSALVMSALGREDIMHIYGDTTLEYPASAEYMKRFKKDHPRTPLLVARNNGSDFNSMCKVVGPPSRVMRWCCTVFKTGAITGKIETIFPKAKSVLVFQGIRRSESVNRSDYDRDGAESKIAKQSVCQVILDWTNFDVWLYLIAHRIDFNDAYRQGFSRVGCWCCPNNSDWSAYLASIYMPQEHAAFMDMLYTFARDEIKKPDWKDYIDEGGWKARQGGDGLEYPKRTGLEVKPCDFDPDSFNFELTRPIFDTLYNLFTPFGLVNTTMGKELLGEVFILDRKTKEPLLKLTGRKGSTQLKVSLLSKRGSFANKTQQTVDAMIRAQVTKYQMCLACSACSSVCKHGAITVENRDKFNICPENVKYHINPDKCVGCLECILHFDNGCYMKKVTRTKIG